MLKVWSISCTVEALLRTGVERALESRASAIIWWPLTNSFIGCQLGDTQSMALRAMYVANPSLSQISDHHLAVTRLPNHWWATSWARRLDVASMCADAEEFRTRSAASL